MQHIPLLGNASRAALVAPLGLAAFLLFTALLSCPAAQPRSLDNRPPARLAGAYRFEMDGWIFVHLEGSPSSIGYQHGYLLAPEIADLLRVVGPYYQHESGRDWVFYRRAAREILWRGIDKEYQDEIDGIVSGLADRQVKADRWDIVALNAIEELPDYYVPWLNKREGQARTPSPSLEHCSAFVATGSYTKDGGIVMGHNNWSDYVTGSRWNIIFDIKPQSGFGILMDGLPGVIVSDDDFGVNTQGIMVTETTIGAFQGFDPDGTPEFFRARKALQYSKSIDDYVAIMLDRNNGGYANDWLLGDEKTGEVALFELGLKNHLVKRTRDGFFIGSNFPVDPKLAKEETNFNLNDPANSANARHTRWEQLIKQFRGGIDVAAAKQFESDGFDVIEGKVDPNERSLCGCVDLSPRGVDGWGKFYPAGTVQTKVIDSQMARHMSFLAAIGHQCASGFVAERFLREHPEYGWMKALLKDMRTQPWARFSSEMPQPRPAE